MHDSKQKTILVSPLNWGLGHATRLIPIIHLLIKKGFKVIIGAYGKSAVVLKSEFPQCKHIELKGFTPSYSKIFSQSFALILQGIPFLFYKVTEHISTSKIVSEQNIDIIISDNRYGVRHKNITSIIITHQISPELNNGYKWLHKAVTFFISFWIRQFNHCWIPDIEETGNLSGILSSNPFHLTNTTSIGLLSRFQSCNTERNFAIDNLAIISGPEPWRGLFEKDIISFFKNSRGKSVIVRGLPKSGIGESITENSITIYNHCDSDILNKLICSSSNIVCRSGYSSIMDLFAAGRRALLIPTPGQPEQEYLAKHMVKNHNFISIQQQQLNSSNLSVFNKYDKNLVPYQNKKLPIILEHFI